MEGRARIDVGSHVETLRRYFNDDAGRLEPFCRVAKIASGRPAEAMSPLDDRKRPVG
jgi:hypothetical protein